MEQPRTMLDTLRALFDKGVRYSTVVDVGCADGHFFLTLFERGLVPSGVPVNIDANAVFEESLAAIKEALGGHYCIAAVTDYDGEVELTGSAHPYWGSLRPADDSYWRRVNALSGTTSVVPATTLDTLRTRLALEPPFLLKLDVQGAETSALRGAAGFLKDTHVVICEADIEDFQGINAMLAENDFFLYDLTHLERIPDGTLGWFYPMYVNRRLDFVRPAALWDPQDNDAVIRAQAERRAAILKSNAALLLHIKQSKQPSRPSIDFAFGAKTVGRNQLCSCGSGRKYKHCCGQTT
jgi:FkbM family methyltransferase